MDHTFLLIGLVVAAIVSNIPLGYLRQGTEKFSFGWFFYIHISIPLIIVLRVKAGFSWQVIPFTLLGAIAGQLVGGIIRKRREQRG